MSEPQWLEYEVPAADVQTGDRLYDRLSKKPFLWPSGKPCPGIVGPFSVSGVLRRGNIVELTVGNTVHLHHYRQLLLIHRRAS